jgi:methionine biosynthesis protein MetW
MPWRRASRALLPRRAYDWLWTQRQAIRRLYAYPENADLLHFDYDAYWREKARERRGELSRWRLRRAQVFASLLGPGDRVLDVGAGDGAVLRYLIAEKQIVATGLDISPDAVAFCREQGLPVVLADIGEPENALPEGTWDYAILSEILEHLPNPEQVVDALRGRVLEGLIVSVPNSGYVAHRVRMLLGRFPLQWVVSPREHLRFWTIPDFEWWAARLNFSIVARYPYEGVRGLKRCWPRLFAAGMVYVLQDRHAGRPHP